MGKAMQASDIHAGDPSSGTIIFYGALGTIGVLIVMGMTIGLFYDAEQQQALEKTYARPNEQLQTLRSEQLEHLSSFGWVDQQAGVARIPIDHAISRTVDDLRSAQEAAH
jgi:hypothetical protein